MIVIDQPHRPAQALKHWQRQPTVLQRSWRQLRREPVAGVAAVAIVGLVVLAVFAPLIAPYDPFASGVGDPLTPPGQDHWFGTDQLGRDLLSRVIFGARISLTVALIAVGLGTTTGVVIGLTCGFFEGLYDLLVQRLMDSILAFPALVLALVVVSMLGPDLTNVMLAVAVVIAPGASRVVRGATLSVKRMLYIEAARAIGVSTPRLILCHLIPNIAAPVIVLASVSMGGAILAETGLSFLGLGAQPPTPAWGLMLSTEGRRFMEEAPWLSIFPGLAIVTAVLSFNLLGDALRDLLDPKLRGR
ncbi:MAG: diguanylate cyclase [Dehalococcoidia bacterium]|nr:MAG: diguanylate cyclase [Dehalococcoidia bacterium]